MVPPRAIDEQVLSRVTLDLEPEPSEHTGAAQVRRHVVGHDAMQEQPLECVPNDRAQCFAHEPLADQGEIHVVAQLTGREWPAVDLRQVGGSDERPARLAAQHEPERHAHPRLEITMQALHVRRPVSELRRPARLGRRKWPQMRAISLIVGEKPWRIASLGNHEQQPGRFEARKCGREGEHRAKQASTPAEKLC